MKMANLFWINTFHKRFVLTNLLAILFLSLFSTYSFSQTIRTVGSGGNYTNLRSAFNAINAGTLTGSIELQIISSVTDNNSAILNASGSGGANYSSIVIYPTGSGYTLSGSYNGALIDLSGADNVTIDGRVNKTGSIVGLIISNTNTGTSASTIRFIDSAQNNTIQYCTVIGAGSSTSYGTIFFSSSSSGTGNDNNTIDNCNITGRSLNAIYSYGTLGKDNSNIIISNNNIYDNITTSTQSSFSIWLDGNTTDCTISENSFYETTGNISPSSSVQHYQFIRIFNETGGNVGNGFVVTDNYIGGTEPLCGGNSMNIGMSSAQNMDLVGIRLAVGTSSATSVQGNIVKNITLKSSHVELFNGIYISTGAVNVGNITGNIFGSGSGTDAIQLISTNNSSVYAIEIVSNANINVSNNIIGAITTSTSTTTLKNDFYGIYKSSAPGNLTVYNNTIGSLTESNSINASSASTSSDQLVYGIYTRGTGIINVYNNTIANLTNSTTRNSSSNGIYGINFGGSTSSSNTIDRNFIYNLGFEGTYSLISVMSGIYIASGITNCFNNVISIGNNVSSPLSMAGIWSASTSSTNYIYHNTVYISGSVSVTTSNTFGFYKSSTSGNINIRDNIFMNARSGGATGYHYAIDLVNTTGVTIDYNDYVFSGTSRARLGRLNATGYNNLSAWKSATGQDANSINVDPLFLSEGGSEPSNYFPRKVLPGTYVSINDDFGNDGIRTGLSNPTMGAWEKTVTYWKGTNGTDWCEKTNWTGNRVPYDYEDVEFATVANYTSDAVNDLVLDKDRVVGNLKNYSPKSLIIPSVSGGVCLTVNDTAKVLNVNSILIKSTSAYPNGSLIFNKPTANTAVPATVEMYSKAYKGTPISWTDPVSGLSYTISYRWQYFGIPVQTLTASPTYNGSYVREYGETTGGTAYYQKWTQLTNFSVMAPFKGYEVTQISPTTFSAQGNLVVGDKTLNLTCTTGNYAAGYNIFGNSYTSAIDISKINFPSSGVEKTVYIYNTGSLDEWGNYRDPATSNSSDLTPGRYYAIPQNTSSVTGEEIPSMQGFLLIATTASTVTIPYNSTTNSLTKNTTLQRVKSQNKSDSINNFTTGNDLAYMQIDVRGDNSFDRTWVFSQDSTSHGFDNGWDGYKLNSTGGICLYSDEKIGALQVNTVDEIDSVYLDFEAGIDTQYELRLIKSIALKQKYPTLYLVDLSLKTVTELNADTVLYSFGASNISAAEKRFLVTNSKEVVDNATGNKNIEETLIKLIVLQNILKLRNYTNYTGNVNLYDAIGKCLMTRRMNSNAETIIAAKLNSGVYLVEINTNDGQRITQKIVIN